MMSFSSFSVDTVTNQSKQTLQIANLRINPLSLCPLHAAERYKFCHFVKKDPFILLIEMILYPTGSKSYHWEV